MNWLFFALFSVLGSAISNILRRVVMKDDKSDAFASTLIFQLMGFVIILIFSLVRGFSLPPLQDYPVHYFFQGLLWGLASLCIFKSSQFLEASETTILTTFTTVVTIFTAIFFLGDVFNIYRLLGVFIILFSVIFVSLQSKKFKLNKGVLYAIAYSVFAGVAITNDAFLLKSTDVFSLLVVGWLTPAIFLIIINPRSIAKMKYFLKKDRLLKIVSLTFFYAISGLAYYLAIAAGGQASQVSPISQASIILTILIAAIFLKERDHLWKKVFSAVLVTIGILLLS